MKYRSTLEVARLLGVNPSRLARAVWAGRIDAPERGPGGAFYWTSRDIAQASWVLRGRSADDLLAAHQGEFSPEAQANVAKGSEAIERVLRDRNSVPAAMKHGELGEITFDWGEPGDPAKDYEGGWGVSHILAQHGAGVVRAIPKVLGEGQIVRRYGPPNGQRVDIIDGKHTAVLSLHRFGKRETWLLTGWKENGPDGPGSDSALSGPTPSGPTLNRPEGVAGPTHIIGATTPEVKASPPHEMNPTKAAEVNVERKEVSGNDD